MALEAFSTPGVVDDLSERGRTAWSRGLDAELTRQVAGDPSVPNDSPRPQFFNPLGVELADDATTKVMRWGAFPRKLSRVPTPTRWELGEDRDRQEEYCEWSAVRDDQGRILRAFFTSEVPSYYLLLARDDLNRLLEVYQKHVSADVQLVDLVSAGGSYRSRNRWNLTGAMHMVQGANTLPAAVLLAAQATIVRGSGSELLTNPDDLIPCGVNADVDRNSDPLIVGDVNELARAGAQVTLADPLGLYIDGLQTTGWEAPDGSDPFDFWTVTRGDPDHAVRAVYEVPPDRGFTVSEITINGTPIRSPSQIAEFVTIKLVGLAHRFAQSKEPPRGCRDEGLAGLDQDLPPVDELLAASLQTR